MSGVTKRAKLRENSPVEFELDGRTVIGLLVKLEDNKAVVRYGLERVITLNFYQVRMIEGKKTEGEIPIGGRPDDDKVLVCEGSEDDTPAYFGTKVGRCYHCRIAVDPAVILNERLLGNWDIPTCSPCVDPKNRPCDGCGQRQVVCICDELEDGRKC